MLEYLIPVSPSDILGNDAGELGDWALAAGGVTTEAGGDEVSGFVGAVLYPGCEVVEGELGTLFNRFTTSRASKAVAEVDG